MADPRVRPRLTERRLEIAATVLLSLEVGARDVRAVLLSLSAVIFLGAVVWIATFPVRLTT